MYECVSASTASILQRILPSASCESCTIHYSRGTATRPVRVDGYQPINIQDDDEDEGVQVVSSRRRRKKKAEPSLVFAFVRSFWVIFLAAAFFKFVQDLLNFVSPQILR